MLTDPYLKKGMGRVVVAHILNSILPISCVPFIDTHTETSLITCLVEKAHAETDLKVEVHNYHNYIYSFDNFLPILLSSSV